jgi:hypothetical protein
MAIKKYVKGSTKRLSENFLASEFMCKGKACCSSGLIDDELVKILQQIRDHFGKPVTINSAYRCPKHNEKVGGSSGSYHKYGQAADIKVKDTAPAEVAKYAESIGVLGIGLYETDADGYFVHIDTRTKKYFWYGQKQLRRETFGGAVEKPVKTVEISLPVLQLGDRGAYVKALQILLGSHGISVGVAGVDGIFGAGTFEALRIYQKQKGLPVTGICDADTWESVVRG